MGIDFDGLWRLAEERFVLGADSIHGSTHWRRVEANGSWLADETPGANVVLVRLFATLHDSCRENECYDPGHGPRAATWAEQLHSRWFASVSDDELGVLCEALRGHDRGQISDDPTIGACWDADRLDLWRVGMTPNAKFMSTAAGRARASGSTSGMGR